MIAHQISHQRLHATGIHIPSCLVVPDDYNLIPTIKITSKAALKTSEAHSSYGRPPLRFCSTTKSFQKFLYDFIHFPCVLITSHLLETFRIMENNNKSSFCLQQNHKFGRLLWWCSIFYETIPGSIFMKYCIQRPFVENVTALIKMWRFLEGVLSPSAGKKRWSRSLIHIKKWHFLEDVSLPLM